MDKHKHFLALSDHSAETLASLIDRPRVLKTKRTARQGQLAGKTACLIFEKASTPDELVGKFDEIDTKSGVGVSNGDTDNFKIKLAEAAFAGKGEDEFKAIIAAENEKWAAARDEILG